MFLQRNTFRKLHKGSVSLQLYWIAT